MEEDFQDNQQGMEHEEDGDTCRFIEDDDVFMDDPPNESQAQSYSMISTGGHQQFMLDTLASNSRTCSYDYRESVGEGSNHSHSSRESSCCIQQQQSLSTPCSVTAACTAAYVDQQKPQEFLLMHDDHFKNEKEFIDFVMSLPSSSKSAGTPSVCHKPQPQNVDPITTCAKELETLKPSQQLSSGGTQSPKVGLDHLENLCKLMEQLGELREQNCKLQKRVQYLEEMKCLNEMRKDLKEALEAATASTTPNRKPSDNDDVNISQAVQCAPDVSLNASSDPSKCTSISEVKLRRSLLKQKQAERGRSQSMSDNELLQQNSAAALVLPKCGSGPGHKSKISKWAKVKEALKWETTQVDNREFGNDGTAGVHGSATQSSFYSDTGNQKLEMNTSKANLSTVPLIQKSDTSDILWHSRDINCDGSAPIFFSRDSFLETSDDDSSMQGLDYSDEHKRQSIGTLLSLDEQCTIFPSRRQSSPTGTQTSQELIINNSQDQKGWSLDRNVDPKILTKHYQSEKDSKKITKGTWGKVLNIIQTRKDSLKRKHRKSGGDLGDVKSHNPEPDLSSADVSLGGDDTWDEICEVGGYLMRPNADDLPAPYDTSVQVKSKHSSSSSNYGVDDITMEMMQQERIVSNKCKGKPQHLPVVASTERQCIDEKAQSASTSLSGYSPNSHRKSKWMKVKKVLLNKRDQEYEHKPQSVPPSPTNPTPFYYNDDLSTLDEYFNKVCNDPKSSYETNVIAPSSIPSDRLSTVASEKYTVSPDAKRNLEEIQRNVSQEFCKKLKEWEKLRAVGTTKYQSAKCSEQPLQQQLAYCQLDRKGSGSKSSKSKAEKEKTKDKQQDREHRICKHREKELQWLEKQLQKIDREKQRLAKERQKYAEREARLEKIRESMMNPPMKREVLVRTSAGEFRFQGISQTFTRKLYEWETMKGIGPEVSTIALLDSQQHPQQGLKSLKDVSYTASRNSLLPPTLKYGCLERSRSRSDGSIADIVNVQTSTTSLANENDDVFLDDIVKSRANSVPDIEFSSREPPCAVEVEEMHYEEFIPCVEIPAFHIEEPVYSYAPCEVIQVIHSDKTCEKVKDQSMDIIHNNKIHILNSSHSLNKQDEQSSGIHATEDICRHLKNELEDIDGRMKLMFQRHAEEICEDDKKQMELIEELQARIQEIAKTSKLLKAERKYLEEIEQQSNQCEQLNMSDTTAGHLKANAKKKGFSRIQTISTELLNQAKTLEEALIARNSTIRQLQCELVQRDRSTKELKEEHHGKPNDNGPHGRLWSSVDGTSFTISHATKQGESKTTVSRDRLPAPNEFSTNNADLPVLPLELTKKVRELKMELMRLWSSGDSTTSEHGQDEHIPCHTLETTQGTKESNIKENETQLASDLQGTRCDKYSYRNASLGMPNSNEMNTSLMDNGLMIMGKTECQGKTFNNQGECNLPDQSITSTTENATERWITDISPPHGLQSSPKQCWSHLPKTFDINSFKASRKEMELDVEAAKASLVTLSTNEDRTKIPQPTRYHSSTLSPTVSNTGSEPVPHKTKAKDTEKCPTTKENPHVNYTVTIKPRITKGTAEFISREHNDNDDATDEASHKNTIMNSLIANEGKKNVIKSKSASGMATTSSTPNYNKLKTNRSISSIGVESSSMASVNKKKITTPTAIKSQGSLMLHRQNAEDFGSSSDTDTEGSGVTFTINLSKRLQQDRCSKNVKTADRKSKIPETNFNTQILTKMKEDKYRNTASCHTDEDTTGTTFKNPRHPLNLPQMPPQSPLSYIPWRKANLESKKSTINNKSLLTQSQLPTPTLSTKSKQVTVPTSPPMISKKSRQKEQMCDGEDEEATAIPPPSTPETPVVKSRSTRKLKLPMTVKPIELGFNNTCSSPVSEVSSLQQCKGPVHSQKEPAPNVRMMVEKFNMKIVQEQNNPSMLRSPRLGIQSKISCGVQKSTSFTAAPGMPVGETVVKSASAGVIEGSRASLSLQQSPQTPEFSTRRKTIFTGQPIGIASRIPRSLNAITEQDSTDTAKEISDTGPIPTRVAASHEMQIAPTETHQQSYRYPSTTEKILQSPLTGVRALQMRRARDEFMTKLSTSSSSSTSPSTSHRASIVPLSCSTPPTPSRLPVSWRNQQISHGISSYLPITDDHMIQRDASDTSISSSEYQRPKGILKKTHKDTTPCVPHEKEPLDATIKLSKSASAGMMEESSAKPMTSTRSSEDITPPQEKTTESRQHPHRSGLFNFKFRKAKIKEKKEPLGTVSALCRQSLFVDIKDRNTASENAEECDSQTSINTRSCPSSPELQPRQLSKGGWLSRPKILFKTK